MTWLQNSSTSDALRGYPRYKLVRFVLVANGAYDPIVLRRSRLFDACALWGIREGSDQQEA